MKSPYVRLYGFNVDVLHLKYRLKKGYDSLLKNSKQLNLIINKVSPAVIATACAGISHQEKSFSWLRKKYRNLDKLISLDKKLVEMGHSSIVEHMFFNFDVVLSRLAVEFLESHRLASYTEKSQRFTEVDYNAFYLPSEHQDFVSLFKKQIELYKKALDLSRKQLKEKFGENWKKYDNKAKEDSRFVLPLAVLAPLNFSVNGRELEYIIQKANSHSLPEIKKFGELLIKELNSKVPWAMHLIKHTEKDAYYEKNKELEEVVKSLALHQNCQQNTSIEVEKDADDKIIAALIFENAQISYEKALDFVKKQDQKLKFEIVRKALKNMEMHHRPPRAFEIPYVTVSTAISASCFAQLKRHRMLTLLVQPYDPDLGYAIPESIHEIGLAKEYLELMDQSSDLLFKLRKQEDPEAEYVVTNGHKRRVIIKMNFRELCLFSRLRQDKHAQWEIRSLANEIVDRVKKDMPITTILLGGKHEFQEIKKLFEKYEQI
ncbi:MAG: FAD-dependent thymidylate synthase [Candidatus Pacearchaeota archaeon]